MRRVLLVLGATAVACCLLAWGWHAFGARSVGFAFLVVWVPMAWLGTLSRVARPQLPSAFHRLRSFERDGRVYELLGIRVVKRALRRGPLAAFNPDLHLPTERTPEKLAHLERRMRDAEAAHAILFVLLCGGALAVAARGWWATAGWILLFDVLLNGYPVLLQRYNRARLAQRFGQPGSAVGSR